MTSHEEQGRLMLAALRSAGATGMTRTELFDATGGKVNSASAAADALRAQGNSVMEEAESDNGIDGPEAWRTTRFTLMADNDVAQPLFEGELAAA